MPAMPHRQVVPRPIHQMQAALSRRERPLPPCCLRSTSRCSRSAARMPCGKRSRCSAIAVRAPLMSRTLHVRTLALVLAAVPPACGDSGAISGGNVGPCASDTCGDAAPVDAALTVDVGADCTPAPEICDAIDNTLLGDE